MIPCPSFYRLFAQNILCLHLAAIVAQKAKGSGRKVFQTQEKNRCRVSKALAESLRWSCLIPNLASLQTSSRSKYPAPQHLLELQKSLRLGLTLWEGVGRRGKLRVSWKRGSYSVRPWAAKQHPHHLSLSGKEKFRGSGFSSLMILRPKRSRFVFVFLRTGPSKVKADGLVGCIYLRKQTKKSKPKQQKTINLCSYSNHNLLLTLNLCNSL